jgi:hypothetical protein
MTKTEMAVLQWGGYAKPLCILAWAVTVLGTLGGLWRMQWHLVWYTIATLITLGLFQKWLAAVRERYLRQATLPRHLQGKLRAAYQHLSPKDCDLIEHGLRQFFMACLRHPRQFVAMPSQVVDVLWHEFILHTKAYKQWCHLGLGHFLHHTPAEALGKKSHHNDGLRRAWFWACKDESIDPKNPSRLPLLFALDAKFAIANGFHYTPDCRLLGTGQTAAANNAAGGDAGGTPYCGTHFSDASYSGSSADFGGADSSDGGGGDAGGCGGGCGGGD